MTDLGERYLQLGSRIKEDNEERASTKKLLETVYAGAQWGISAADYERTLKGKVIKERSAKEKKRLWTNEWKAKMREAKEKKAERRLKLLDNILTKCSTGPAPAAFYAYVQDIVKREAELLLKEQEAAETGGSVPATGSSSSSAPK